VPSAVPSQLKHNASSSSLGNTGGACAAAKPAASSSLSSGGLPATGAASLGGREASGAHAAPAAEQTVTASTEVTPSATATSSEQQAASATTGVAPQPVRKANRRSACLMAPEAAAAAAAAYEEAAKASDAHQTASSASTGDKQRPPVPLFPEPAPAAAAPAPAPALEPFMALREIQLPPKTLDDNYEMSEHGEDSDAEDSHAKDRSHKHVPAWCRDYLEKLKTQHTVDPDTIFGSKVPQIVLEDIFTSEMYRQANKSRPKRTRGSSGDWRKDRLTRQEVANYKSRMDQTRAWDEPVQEEKENK